MSISRLRRRAAVAGVAVASLGALVLAGCSSSAASPSGTAAAAAAGTPVSGDSLTYGVETGPLTLNPQLSSQDKARVTLRHGVTF